MKKVKVISGEFGGNTFDGHRFYYDYKHIGSSPDLFMIATSDGEKTITSDKVDVEHYEKQLFKMKSTDWVQRLEM